MLARYVTVDRDTSLLLPPSLHDWVPEDLLVHFVIEAVEQLDLSAARVNQRGSGSEQYPPATMLALLVYSCATGTFASRRIEQSTFDNVAVRYLCADTHPDHDTLCAFRRENRALLSSAFAQILELAARSGQLHVGGITGPSTAGRSAPTPRPKPTARRSTPSRTARHWPHRSRKTNTASPIRRAASCPPAARAASSRPTTPRPPSKSTAA